MQSHALPCQVYPVVTPEQQHKLVNNGHTPSNQGGDGCALDTHGRNGPPSKNQQRVKRQVDQVGHPHHAHRNGGIARTAEHGIDDKQDHDNTARAKHDGRVHITLPDHLFRSTHDSQEMPCPDNARKRKQQGYKDGKQNGLKGCHPGLTLVALPYPPGHQRGGGGTEPTSHSIHDGHHRFGYPYGSHRIGPQLRDVKNIDNRKNRFHDHLQYHRYRKDKNGLADARFGKITLGTRDSLPDILPDLFYLALYVAHSQKKTY